MELVRAFSSHLRSFDLPPGRLLAAVSGGPDSVALLDLLAACRAELRLDVVVAHVDHGIHPDSATIADQVRRLAATYGVPCLTRALTLGPGVSETTARGARLKALEEMRRESGARWIATAHHADDQVETVLMRTLAGSGPAGLAAMAARRGRVIRPLLPFRREELARHVQSSGLWSWNDPANRDPQHLRSWLRTEILPALRTRVPDADAQLLRVVRSAACDRAAWDAVLDVLPALDLRTEMDAVSVAASVLAGYDSKLACGLVMALARRVGCTLGATRAERVLDLARTGASGRSLPLGAGWMAEVGFGRLRIGRQPVAEATPWPLAGSVGKGSWGAWRLTWSPDRAPERQSRAAQTAWFAPGSLAVRAWREGERLRPLGGTGRRLVVRCFQDAKVPRSLRLGWPVLEHEGVPVWVPGVCRSDLLLPNPSEEALRVDAELA